MNQCKSCGSVHLAVYTKTTFGQGDSMHETYVRCENCGRESAKVTDWGWFSDEDLRKAQQYWDKENPE